MTAQDWRGEQARYEWDGQSIRRYADPHSVIAAELLRQRLGRLQAIGRRIRELLPGVKS